MRSGRRRGGAARRIRSGIRVFGFGKRDAFERKAAPDEVTLRALAWVENGVAKPRPQGWERVESSLRFLPEFAPMLEGLERYSHALVTFWMDLAVDAPEKPAQVTLKSGRRYGILATRSQLRPNHLGVSVVRVLGVEGAVVRVVGLDAINGTPVLDIKPYLPEYDAEPGATIPNG